MPDLVWSPLTVDPALLACDTGLGDAASPYQQEIPNGGFSGTERHAAECAAVQWAEIDNEAPSFYTYDHPREGGGTIHDQNCQDLQDLFGLHIFNHVCAAEQEMIDPEELQGTPQREDQRRLESIDAKGPEPAFMQDVEALHSPETTMEWKKRALTVIFVDFYIHLTHNEEDANDIQPLVRRCAEYFYVVSQEAADDTIGMLTLLRHAIESPSPRPEFGPKAQIAGPNQIQSGQLQASESHSPSSRATKTSKKPPRTIKTSARVIDHHVPPLMREVNKECSFKYRGLIRDSSLFLQTEREYMRILRQESKKTTEDPTWPADAKHDRRYIRQLVEAIVDLSDFEEKRVALAKKQALDEYNAAEGPGKRKRDGTAHTKPPAPNKSEAVYLNPEKTNSERLEAAVGRKLSDVEIEIQG
ncbi:hypothetical protein K4K53_006326 [Colletotrichum sp. SAR 10_77]|nr:hypothetical protein K4K51_006813 [Colletotrichum sp. SAR 10_75]KAI8225924.1 hypothetical protein K4K53_006326 [Colletotrichum sp. SAR 10_77]